MRGLAILAAVVAACAGCGDDNGDLDGSASSDGGSADLSAPDGGGALAGGFTIVGCAMLDQSTPTPVCTATAPAQLTFVPLAAGVTDFVWSFPGGTPSSSMLITPVVSYTQPGAAPFIVTLAAGGPGGTTVTSGKIIISAGSIGATCHSDADCDLVKGLTCVCGAGRACPGSLSVGICTRPCAPGEQICVAGGEYCADLSRSFVEPPPPDGGEPDGGADSDDWRRPLCLRACATNADCRVGLTCREIPALDPGAASGGAFTWQKACFADTLGDVGASCAAPDGTPAGDRCLSGRCDPLGARSMCTSDCATVSCPSYAACAAFNATPAIHECLPRCDGTHPCDDPLLDCLPPGGTGNFGYTLMPPDPPGTMYCSPKKCAMPSDCAPAGTCVAGFCK
jgi:hypothetical protein